MADEGLKDCAECGGTMSPVVIMDKVDHGGTPRDLEYRQPDDSRRFWSGRYPTAGRVRGFLCAGCGRIALYGSVPDAEPGAAADRGEM
jgi:hypothetical protein